MDGEKRRLKIAELLQSSNEPISGNELAKQLGVSRQIVVQDIALLKASNKNILATNKGYMMFLVEPKKMKKSFLVKHSTDDIEDELNTIIENKGKVLDVVVEHDIYGQITVDLIIETKKDIEECLQKLRENNTRPLKELTGGYHYHTVEADTIEELCIIENLLKEKGYLINKE